jgi:4-hydroxy-tetrahydrodipicolinate synthase
MTENHRDTRAAMAGLFAAVATPIHSDGRVDVATLERLIDFLVEAGVSGVCLAGATGEYPHFETADRKTVIRRAAARLPRDRALLVGIGGPTMRHTIDLGETALQSGSRGVLMPMPMFFRYEQDDLSAFSKYVSDALRGPCLLYNLPDFTNGLAPATVIALLREAEFIVGIKDSSGQLDHLAAFAEARNGEPWTLLVGDDRALLKGLQAGWDGSISGVAGFCPELLVALYRSHVAGHAEEASRLQDLLDELIAQLSPFPTPWGIRIGLAARGIDTGPLPLPVTATRKRQIAAFTAWLPEWLVRNGLERPVDAAARIARR